ncbi:MAG: ABC transporter permease, partial [Xanthobacteraceae bacterium]
MSALHFQRSAYPLIGILLILGIWQGYTSLSGISPLVLPSPLEIASVSVTRYDLLLHETWPTLVETLLGFCLALAIGIPLAVCVANSRLLNLILYPI